MNTNQEKVEKFMKKASQRVEKRPTLPDPDIAFLHANLILEESLETIRGFGFEVYQSDDGSFQLVGSVTPNLVAAYDGLADLSYVTNGAANAFGLDLQSGFEEAHDSNMSKFIDGHRRADGKWVKGKSYRKADFQKLIDEQTIKWEESCEKAELIAKEFAEERYFNDEDLDELKTIIQKNI